MFEVKRREQLSALKNLVQLNDVHQQYKILDVMLKGLFQVRAGAGPLLAGLVCDLGTEGRVGVTSGDGVQLGATACTKDRK